MRKTITILTVGVICLTVAAATVSGQARGKASQTTAATSDKTRATLPASEPLFSKNDVTVITRWFHDNKNHLPPGLAKRESLPPGLAKQIQKNGKLPPGLEKKMQPVPVALELKLPVLPSGYRRVVIGVDIVIMNPMTEKVFDIVRNVIQ